MKQITSLQLSKKYAGKLQEWQHKQNAEFFDNVWNMLNDDGVYIYPHVHKMFKKCPNKTWIEV